MTNRDTGNAGKRTQMIRRRRRRRHLLASLFLFSLFLICLGLLAADYLHSNPSPFTMPPRLSAGTHGHTPLNSPFLPEGTPDELVELLEHNRETYDFVTEYPNRETYLNQEIDLSTDKDVTGALDAGEVPLLMQWDPRWGYAPYGDDMVGLAGCGPTCLSMAYIYLTGNTDLHPAAMAEFAYQQGYYSEYGTDWALWTGGVSLLGLSGETLPLSEPAMKNALQDGAVIICSMRPGDFTTTGHLILIRDYDENGFYVNDPNRRSNSDRQWTFDELSHQIKNLWGIRLPASPM